jgi:hypothetical protein
MAGGEMIRLWTASLALTVGCLPVANAIAPTRQASLSQNESNQIVAGSTHPASDHLGGDNSGPVVHAGDAKNAASRQLGNPLWEISLAELPATRERPIFSPSRRAPAPAIAAASTVEPVAQIIIESQPELPPFTLVGTVHSDSENLGVFFDETSKEVVRLHVGQADADWVLQSVASRTTTVEKNGQRVTLALPAAGSEPAPSSSAPRTEPPSQPNVVPSRNRQPHFPRSAKMNSEF